MLILDYRTNEIRDVEENELSFVAPECYVKVIENENLNGVYVYAYSIKDTSRFIDWNFLIEDVNNGHFNFKTMLNKFLEKYNLTCEDVELYDKVLYLNKKTIGKCQE